MGDKDLLWRLLLVATLGSKEFLIWKYISTSFSTFLKRFILLHTSEVYCIFLWCIFIQPNKTFLKFVRFSDLVSNNNSKAKNRMLQKPITYALYYFSDYKDIYKRKYPGYIFFGIWKLHHQLDLYYRMLKINIKIEKNKLEISFEDVIKIKTPTWKI